ncbi:MAG: sigma-54 interaction domain-containing protein [bacterium]
MTGSFLGALQYHRGNSSAIPITGLKRDEIIGSSSLLESCLIQLAQIANSDDEVFITGETGTGKELFARAIHLNSSRKHNNFVTVDCTALPETLVESILFGHVKGAYTGADKADDGLIKQADKGTLFLDEAGELSLTLQAKFLRVLEAHRFLPIKGKREIHSDFRLITATNRNLEEMVKKGKFRKDLYYRLKSFPISLPPLRSRAEDIKEITERYLTRYCQRKNLKAKKISPDFITVLTAYDWPGNVRELINALNTAFASCPGQTLFHNHLPDDILVKAARTSVNTQAGYRKAKEFPNLKQFRESAVAKAEREYLEEIIAFTQGNINEASKIADLSRSRFHTLRKKHNIKANRTLNGEAT